MKETETKGVKDQYKKQAENDQLRRFKEAFASFPRGAIVPNEHPDFIVETEQGNVGVEVTNLYRDSQGGSGFPLRAEERRQDKILWRAARLYEAKGKGLPFVDVGVYWSFHMAVTKAREQDIAIDLADLVAAHLPSPSDHTLLAYPHPAWKLLPPEVDHMHVYCPVGLSKNVWGSSRSTAVPKLRAQDIKEAILAKEGKLHSYRRQCSEAWLLIVADGLAPSNHFEWDKEVGELRFDTGFDRVFFLHYANGFVAELKRNADVGVSE